MGGIHYSASLETVTAACGHKESVYIPPFKYRPGPVGKRNVAGAQAAPCFRCRLAGAGMDAALADAITGSRLAGRP